MNLAYSVSAAAFAAAIALASCSLEPYALTPEELYTRQFIKEFGLIDPQQDWNMAVNTTVDINLGGSTSDVKIYARVDGTYYLCASLERAGGELSVPVDVPDGTREVAVRIDGRLQYGPITDTFGHGHPYGKTGSRAKISDEIIARYTLTEASTTFTDADGKTYTVTSKYGPDPNDTDLYQRFNAMQMGPLISKDKWADYYSLKSNTIHTNTDGECGILPEGNNNTNNKGIIQDFALDAGDNGKFVIVPMYLNTRHSHEVGVYLVDDNGEPILDPEGKIKLFPVIKNDRENGTIEKYDKQSSTTSRAIPSELIESQGKWEDISWVYLPVYGTSDGVVSRLLLRSRSFLVDVGDYRGKIGMYIRFEEDNQKGYINLFSQTKRNTANNMDFSQTILEGESYAAAYKHPVSRRTFFSFEDWINWDQYTKGDNDLNDLIFHLSDFEEISNDEDKIEEEEPDDEVTETPISWIVAAEDLGSTDDFDFNDIIMRLTCVTVSDGKNQPTRRVEIQALAAGGTLPAYLHYCTPEGKDYLLKPGTGADGMRLTSEIDPHTAAIDYEWHSWFGSVAGQFRHTQMINTRGGASSSVSGVCVLGGAESDPAGITQALKDFSIEKYSQSSPGKGVEGFYVTINSHLAAQQLMQGIDGNNDPNSGRTINGGAIGAAPQMFLIPDMGHKAGQGWYWPAERQHIISVYPAFKTWVNDAASATDWHKTTTNEGRIMRINPERRSN